MSMEDEIRNSPIKSAQSFQEPNKQSKIAYTRSFLLSLSELDVCKELPSGFDQAILSEFEDAYSGLQDRQRNHGNFPLQSFRRSEYGSSPPTRGDTNNFTRGHGRRDSNSGSWNDKDSDTQSDRDSDTGRRYGNLSRRSSQTSEHDGLLGSGSFPRPSSSYTAGLSASKSARPNDHYQLNKSTEPYHPPRPYKAVPQGRRETKDSFNDETFGSSESTSQDKIEDERRRRASFEMMRKEQHKSLQENQKQDPGKHRDGQVANISELLDDTSRDVKKPLSTSDVDEPVNLLASVNSSKSSLQSQVSRPRVPPGFKSTTIPEKDSLSEVGISKVEETFSLGKAIGQNDRMDSQVRQQTHIQNQLAEKKGADIPLFNTDKPILLPPADPKLSSILDVSLTINGSGKIKKMSEHKASGEMKQDGTSILEKIFGTNLMLNIHGSPDANELPDKDDGQDHSDAAVQSSKFAHWFVEDEKKTSDPSSFGRGNSLLSLIGVSDNKVTDVKAATTQQTMKEFSFLQAPDAISGNKTSPAFGFSNQGNTPAPPPPNVVLTCEDLEQTILSEYGENRYTTDAGSWNRPLSLDDMQPTTTTTSTATSRKTDIDNSASQHLLALLQKGKGGDGLQENVKQSSSFFNGSHVYEDGANVRNTKVEVVENNNNNSLLAGKSLTLETLFGSAFMEELQSVNAPVSAQRGGVGTRRSDIPEHHGQLLFGVTDHENDALRLNQRQQTKIDDSVREENVPDSLFSLSVKPTKSDSQPPVNRDFNTMYRDEQQQSPFGRRQQEMSVAYHNANNNNFQLQSSSTSSPLVYQPFFNSVDAYINHHNSLEKINQDDGTPRMMNQQQFPGGGSMNIMHQLLPSHHHSTAARQPTTRGGGGVGGGFDHLPFHHLMLQQQQQQQQMSAANVLQPPHMRPPPPQSSGGFVQELNAMQQQQQQGFPFPHQPPSPIFNGQGMMHSTNGSDAGNNNHHSEAVRSIIEMEHRANTTKLLQQQQLQQQLQHGLDAGNNNNLHSEAVRRMIEMEHRANITKQQQQHGMFGHDLDIGGFRYR